MAFATADAPCVFWLSERMVYCPACETTVRSDSSLTDTFTSVTGDSPTAPLPYDPRFSRVVTVLSAIVLCASIGLFAWFMLSLPRLDRVASPERALHLMVSRMMDVEEALRRAPEWERVFYEIAVGSDANERDQAIAWYEELSSYSEDPAVHLNLAVLEAESGRLSEVMNKAGSWMDAEAPFPLFARLLRGAYQGERISIEEEQGLQAELAELLPAGWFYDRLAIRLARQAGDHALLASVEAASTERAEALLWRSRALAATELAVMLVGGTVLVSAWLRRCRTDVLRVGPASLPPRWPGGVGAAVLLRGGAIGAVLTVAFLFAAIDYSSLRVLAIPLTNLPLLLLARRHLLKPAGLGFAEGFGLKPARRDLPRFATVVPAIMAAGLLGEWVLGKVIESLSLSSHWTEWFDADLVWAPPSVMSISLLEYVIFAPVFEELAFRGLLFAILRRRYGWERSALISAGIFAVAHGYGLVGFLSVFWSGVVWAWAYERTGSLLPGMIAHAANNLFVCLSVIALLRF
jgi:membrane protease YdiL (CAAX protease family)